MEKGVKYNQPENLTKRKIEEPAISGEQVIQTMKYDARPEARTQGEKIQLNIKKDSSRKRQATTPIQQRITSLSERRSKKRIL
jgi:hypothetical protein